MYGGKYESTKTLLPARLKRLPMEWSLRSLVAWSPMRDPEPGYTVIIGGLWRLRQLAAANLRFIAHQNAPRMKEVILAFDVTRADASREELDKLHALAGDTPLRILTYSTTQHKVAKFFEWGWIYAWMNWSKGISACSTRHVLLHDLDAIPLDPAFFERRYDMANENGADFFGVSWYEGNGVEPRDRVTRTYEMVMNAETVRRVFRPIDGFNKVARFGPRTFDFDTFCYMQMLHRSSDHAPMNPGEVVHPSQMITNTVDLLAGRLRGINPQRTNLPLIPIYTLLGGDPTEATNVLNTVPDGGPARIPLLGKQLDLSRYSREHWAWLRESAERLAARLPDDERATAIAYLDRVESILPNGATAERTPA